MADKEGRNLEFGGEFVAEQEAPPEVIALRLRMKEFVNSPFWPDVQHVLNECLGGYKVDPPKRDYDRYAYEVYNHVRDAYSQFSWLICELASKGEIYARGGQTE